MSARRLSDDKLRMYRVLNDGQYQLFRYRKEFDYYEPFKITDKAEADAWLRGKVKAADEEE